MIIIILQVMNKFFGGLNQSCNGEECLFGEHLSSSDEDDKTELMTSEDEVEEIISKDEKNNQKLESVPKLTRQIGMVEDDKKKKPTTTKLKLDLSSKKTKIEKIKKEIKFNQFYFFTDPITIETDDPVILQKTKSAYRVKDVSDRDMEKIKTAMKNVDEKLEIGKASFEQFNAGVYIPGEKAKLVDVIGREMETMPKATGCRIKVEIRGYREKDGEKTPMWVVKEAQYNYQ